MLATTSSAERSGMARPVPQGIGAKQAIAGIIKL